MEREEHFPRWWTNVECDSIHETAAEWFARMQEPALSLEETAAWQTWLHSDPRHIQAYQRIEEVWTAARRIEDRGDHSRLSYDFNIPIGEWLERRVARRRALWWGMTSAVAAVVLSVAVWLVFAPRGLRIETRVGQHRTVSLADGSQVEVGGATVIRVRFNDALRRVELTRGEALFTVAKDPTRPFQVGVDQATVTAVGTAFNIRRVSQKVEVAVIEGNVKITDANAAVSVPLAAGEQTVVVKSRIGTATRTASPATVTAWTSGRLSFDQESLQDAVDVVNRYAAKPIVVEDASVGQLQITGAVRSDNIGAWIRSLENAFGLMAVETADHIELRRNAQ